MHSLIEANCVFFVNKWFHQKKKIFEFSKNFQHQKRKLVYTVFRDFSGNKKYKNK